MVMNCMNTVVELFVSLLFSCYLSVCGPSSSPWMYCAGMVTTTQLPLCSHCWDTISSLRTSLKMLPSLIGVQHTSCYTSSAYLATQSSAPVLSLPKVHTIYCNRAMGAFSSIQYG